MDNALSIGEIEDIEQRNEQIDARLRFLRVLGYDNVKITKLENEPKPGDIISMLYEVKHDQTLLINQVESLKDEVRRIGKYIEGKKKQKGVDNGTYTQNEADKTDRELSNI